MHHVYFICRTCGRYISGCLLSCPADHKVEDVDSCAICARKEADGE